MGNDKTHLRGMVITLHPSPDQEAFLRRIVGAQLWLKNRFLACNAAMK